MYIPCQCMSIYTAEDHLIGCHIRFTAWLLMRSAFVFIHVFFCTIHVMITAVPELVYCNIQPGLPVIFPECKRDVAAVPLINSVDYDCNLRSRTVQYLVTASILFCCIALLYLKGGWICCPVNLLSWERESTVKVTSIKVTVLLFTGTCMECTAQWLLKRREDAVKVVKGEAKLLFCLSTRMNPEMHWWSGVLKGTWNVAMYIASILYCTVDVTGRAVQVLFAELQFTVKYKVNSYGTILYSQWWGTYSSFYEMCGSFAVVESVPLVYKTLRCAFKQPLKRWPRLVMQFLCSYGTAKV